MSNNDNFETKRKQDIMLIDKIVCMHVIVVLYKINSSNARPYKCLLCRMYLKLLE